MNIFKKIETKKQTISTVRELSLAETKIISGGGAPGCGGAGPRNPFHPVKVVQA